MNHHYPPRNTRRSRRAGSTVRRLSAFYAAGETRRSRAFLDATAAARRIGDLAGTTGRWHAAGFTQLYPIVLLGARRADVDAQRSFVVRGCAPSRRRAMRCSMPRPRSRATTARSGSNSKPRPTTRRRRRCTARRAGNCSTRRCASACRWYARLTRDAQVIRASNCAARPSATPADADRVDPACRSRDSMPATHAAGEAAAQRALALRPAIRKRWRAWAARSGCRTSAQRRRRQPARRSAQRAASIPASRCGSATCSKTSAKPRRRAKPTHARMRWLPEDAQIAAYLLAWRRKLCDWRDLDALSAQVRAAVRRAKRRSSRSHSSAKTRRRGAAAVRAFERVRKSRPSATAAAGGDASLPCRSASASSPTASARIRPGC